MAAIGCQQPALKGTLSALVLLNLGHGKGAPVILKMFSLPSLLLYMEKLLQAQTTFNGALLSSQNASSEQKSRVRSLEIPC